MGLSRGPVNSLVTIKVGDITAYEETVTANGFYDINQPYLFGGDDREGGIVGTFYMMFGAEDQVVPDLIKTNLSGLVPDFKGVTTLLYYGQVCSNNPYPKSWKFRVRRYTAGWDNDDPWNPDKALILLTNLPTAVLTFVANPVPGDFVSIGGTAIHFNDFGGEVTIAGDEIGTAANFTNYVNDNSGSLSDVTATSNGNTVQLSVDSGSLPSITQVGYVTISSGGGDIYAMNGAHIIYEAATNRAWGRGLPAALINEDSFLAAADTLFNEGLGLCIRWNREDDLDSFVQTILNHIGGVVYTDPRTGLLSLDLIRQDYEIENLALFDFNSGLLDILEDNSTATDTTFNEIVVTYHDPITDQDGQVRAHDLAAIQSIGQTISTTTSYPGIPTASLAHRIADRDLSMQSTTLRRMKIKLDRAGAFLKPGGVFRLSVPTRGIDLIVLRIGQIEDSPITDGSITITAAEDIFSLAATSYMKTENPVWVPPDRTAHAITIRRIEELNYRDLASNLSPADLASVEPDSAAIKALAHRPTNLSLDYIISTALGSEDFMDRGLNGFEPNAILNADIGYYDTAITFGLQTDMATIVSGGTVLIDDEYLRIDAIDLTAGTATVARGVVDTIPATHLASTRLWFEDAIPGTDGREYSSGETVHVKLLTRTSTSRLLPADAPTDDIVLGGRQGRPFPPGNMRIGGTPFGSISNVTGDVVFTWAHRDRLTEGDFLLEHGAGSTGPEAGTTYNVLVYNGADDPDIDSPVRSVTGISGTTWTYDSTMASADGNLRTIWFVIESQRDGLVSWQHYKMKVNRPSGFGDDFGFNFGGYAIVIRLTEDEAFERTTEDGSTRILEP